MKRKSDKPLSKHTLNLFEGQLAWLQDNHGRLGAAAVIRELIAAHIRNTSEGLAQRVEPIPPSTVHIEEILP